MCARKTSVLATLLLMLWVTTASAITLEQLRDIAEVDPPTAELAVEKYPEYVRFVSNDEKPALIETQKLLDGSGPLASKVKLRDQMRTSFFVDVPYVLLQAMLDYYRYDGTVPLQCPPVEQVSREVCLAAMGYYMPGVPVEGANGTQNSVKEKCEYIGEITCYFNTGTVIYPPQLDDLVRPHLNNILSESTDSDGNTLIQVQRFWLNCRTIENVFHYAPAKFRISMDIWNNMLAVLHVETRNKPKSSQ